MMDPLLTVPPLTPTLPSSSVINLVSCSKQSNGHAPTVFKDELIKKENVTIRVDDLKDLLEFFAKTTYKARDTQPKVQHVMLRCMHLFGIDYNYSVLPNTSGELSTNYPSSLIILESEKDPQSPAHIASSVINGDGEFSNGGLYASCSHSADLRNGGLSSGWRLNSNLPSGLNSVQESNLELPKLRELCSRARRARCRARFPVPVILYNQKHICRSATLSGGPEIYGRSSLDYFFPSGGIDPELGGEEEEILSEVQSGQSQSDWQLFDRVRSQDIRLLKTFQVETIVDLMVEKKKVKFGVNVTSSEKVDKENRYADFNIVSLPYPGCEFFKQYRDNGYCAEELVFEWNQGHVDANICVPSDPTAASINLDWSQYRDWDLVVLSQNYLKLLLGYLRDRDRGLLIHCISGWDRTPLFVSLLRLSLWADGAIHKSLDADQILYLTLAYDWLLFGHNLEDRLNKGEEILFFCFNFLKYIVDPQFSIHNISEVPKTSPLSRVRNDSDVHLEGVLLDNEACQTSPEGSNWSLNSCSSTHSSKSQEPAPAYFQVSNDSWDESSTAQPHTQHLSCQSQNGSNHSLVHILSQYPKLTTNGSFTGSCIISASMINSTPTTPTPEDPAGGFSKSQSPNKMQLSPQITPTTAIPSTPKSIENTLLQISALPPSLGKNEFECGSPHGRTSPVAVPLPNRLQLNHHTRHESNSSASIGSWQLITGNGSLRENVFSSVPSSYSSHSHPSRLSANLEVDGIESSESSCTLVEDLTPMESKPSLLEVSSQFRSDELGPSTTTNQGIRFEEELGLALDESFKFGVEDFRPGPPLPPTSLDLMNLSLDDETVITASTTPTKEQEGEDIDVVDGNIGSIVFTNNNNVEAGINSEMLSHRVEKLDKVRSRFYTLYQGTIRTNRNVNESFGTTSSGLGFTNLFGNIATKVGIRSSANRTTHV